jgi:HD-GYP domain-containing protein (c-di-GMP phosphodiesterase class II)
MLVIPGELTLSRSTPTSADRKLIESHVEQGVRIAHTLTGIASNAYVIPAIRYHHEWWDGSGYPKGLAGEEIPVAARITSLADNYDSLTHSRVWRDAMRPEEALTHIRSRFGTQFSPAEGEVFCDLVQRLLSIHQSDLDRFLVREALSPN